MRRIIKNNIKLIIGIIVGIILSGFTVYASTILFNSNAVGYDNTNTNLQINNADVDNVQDAIDAIYQKLPPTCSSSPFQLGDYIDMTPTSSSFTPDAGLTGCTEAGTSILGNLNPSELSV